jgi:hypothetical protein
MSLKIIKTDLLKPYQELIDNHSLDLAFNNLIEKLNDLYNTNIVKHWIFC